MRNRIAVCILVAAAGAMFVGCGQAPEPADGEGRAQAGDQGDSSFDYTPPSADYSHGIDVSYYEGNINWTKVKDAGNDFAFIRLSDGTHHVDSKFDANWAGAKSAGVIRGAYQFFRPAQSATAQANLLLDKMGALEPGDLPPTLDVEVMDGVSASHIRSGIATWLQIVRDGTGTEPIIYTSPGFWDGLNEGPQTTSLWDAHWRVSQPHVASSWDDWTFWQYTDSGSVSGIPGVAVDLNVFHGSTDDLVAWAGGSMPTPTPSATPTPSPSPSPTPVDVPAPLHGVDVTTYDGTVNWPQVKAAGKYFAFVRVSYGTSVDGQFATNWAGTKSAGVVRGAVQLFRPDQNATTQANLLLSKIGTPQAGDLPPVLDVEVTGGMSNATIRSGIATWTAVVRNAIGRDPIIRTTPGFWNNLGEPALPNPLWVVHWGVTSPQSTLPSGWTQWRFWQYSASATVSGMPGSPGAASVDEFNGSLADLMAFAY
jgi:lysozyme